MTTTMQERAREARDFFELKYRSEEKEGFWGTKDGRPEWVVDLCRAAHEDGAILPDDERYRFIVETLDLLAEVEDPDEAEDGIEADIYTSDLTRWLNSRASRADYLTQAITEDHHPTNSFEALQYAQTLERREVFNAVRAFLEKRDDEGGET